MWVFDPYKTPIMLEWLANFWGQVLSDYTLLYSIIITLLSVALEDRVMDMVNELARMVNGSYISGELKEFLITFVVVAVAIPFTTFCVLTLYWILLCVFTFWIPAGYSYAVNFLTDFSNGNAVWLCQLAGPPMVVIMSRCVRSLKGSFNFAKIWAPTK